MAVPLEDYTVREKGIVSYDTLKSVAKEYGTTAQALKYFNRYSPYYDEIKKLNTGEGLFNFASKIDPAKIPKLKVPKIPTGGNTTNTTAGSVSSSSYNSIVSKRIILKRINASYGTALVDNTPLGGIISGFKSRGINSRLEFYANWSPLYDMLYYMNLATTEAESNQVLNKYIQYFAKILRVENTEPGRISAFNINNVSNVSKIPPDSNDDKKKVLATIQDLVDLFESSDSYGHWWIEIYNTDISLPSISGSKTASQYSSVVPNQLIASYGFWPLGSAGKGSGALYGSVPGGINRISPPFDPTSSNHKYDPYANTTKISWKVDKALFSTDPYGRSESEIYDDILDYLLYYPSDRNWAWPDTSEEEEHCQSFQKELLTACGLTAAPEIKKDQYPPLDNYSVFWGDETLPPRPAPTPTP